MERSNTLIELTNISKVYGHVTALKSISFSLERGSFLSIFGSNGAGKSTLLKILSHQTRPSSGELTYSGVPLKKLSDDFRRNFGVISHLPFLYENLTALENLEFYARLYNVKKPAARAAELLKRVDLYSRKDDLVRTFSRGMLQRVSIARSLVHDPEMIFLDEPYTGLDSVASNALTSILEEQITSNKTIIMVTHDLGVGLALASDIIIMKRGDIVYNKKKADIDTENFSAEYLQYAANGGAVS